MRSFYGPLWSFDVVLRHYGHPDLMNKQPLGLWDACMLVGSRYMMQQGGISKGTRSRGRENQIGSSTAVEVFMAFQVRNHRDRTLNLSEDIFAGLDFTLRADDRRICHKAGALRGFSASL